MIECVNTSNTYKMPFGAGKYRPSVVLFMIGMGSKLGCLDTLNTNSDVYNNVIICMILKFFIVD